jgi:molybdopterin converting factor small subunit
MTPIHRPPSANPSPITHHPSPCDPPTPSVTVELFGVPRLLVGARSLTAAGATLADLAADLVRRSPALAGRVLDVVTGWPLDGYSFVVDEQFTRDRSLPLPPGTSVLLVASAAGG